MLDRGVQHDVQVLDNLPIAPIALRDLAGQLRGLVEDAVYGATPALEDGGDERVGDVVLPSRDSMPGNTGLKSLINAFRFKRR